MQEGLDLKPHTPRKPRDPRRNRHDEVADCAFPHFCRARELLLALTGDELELAMASAPEPFISQLIRSMGFQSRSRRTPQMLRTRFAKLPGRNLHFLVWMLAATPIETLADAIDYEDDDDSEELNMNVYLPLRDGGLAKGAEKWPPAILRLAVETLWDRSFLGVEERDELLVLLGDTTMAVPLPEEDNEDEEDEPAEAARVVEDVHRPVTTDDWLAAAMNRALDSALAPGATEGDVHRQVAGLEWLLDLDPTLTAAWFIYGRLTTLLVDAGTTRQPHLAAMAAPFTAGRIQGLADAKRAADVVQLTTDQTEIVEHLLNDPLGPHVTAAILESHLGQPREAARLLGFVRHPFDGWRAFVRRAREDAAQLLSAGAGSEAEILLRAVEERLVRWAALLEQDGDDFMPEAVATTVLRASCRRRRHDFVGAADLLNGIDLGDLDVAGQTAAFFEMSMAAAEVGGLDQLSFPAARDRSRWAERLQRAKPHMESVVENDPSHLEANLLAGMASFCVGNDAEVARYLSMVGDRLTDCPETRALGAAVRFHRALARLRLLEEGNDEGAHYDMASSMADGYVPDEAELTSAAMAIEAHGSPHAGEYLARAVALAPSSSVIAALVVERAGNADPIAMGIAEEMAADHKRRLVERFDLLDAALRGAEGSRDTATAERLAGLIDDVVVRANRPVLDARWAASLDAGETLRAALEPSHADAMRMEVLRRAGHMDEALAIATGLFYRAAAGSLRIFDAAELLEVLRELGAGDETLGDLARLVPAERGIGESDSRPALTGPTVVVFVGGNETQEQYRSYLDDEIERRYGGQVTVEWFFSGWSSNWMKVAEGIKSTLQMKSPDAVVLMTFVRTNLGQWTRRTAGEHGLPWVACTGHGRDAIALAIGRAVAVAEDRRLHAAHKPLVSPRIPPTGS